jgi:hypothetical protein
MINDIILEETLLERLEKMFISMTHQNDASRLPWNRRIHERVIPFLQSTFINSAPVQFSQDAKLHVCKAQMVEYLESDIGL